MALIVYSRRRGLFFLLLLPQNCLVVIYYFLHDEFLFLLLSESVGEKEDVVFDGTIDELVLFFKIFIQKFEVICFFFTIIFYIVIIYGFSNEACLVQQFLCLKFQGFWKVSVIWLHKPLVKGFLNRHKQFIGDLLRLLFHLRNKCLLQILNRCSFILRILVSFFQVSRVWVPQSAGWVHLRCA